MTKGKKKTARARAKTAKADTGSGEHIAEWYADAEQIEQDGIKTGEDAYRILRGILERQDGANSPGDGDEMFMFCEAFKALDEHMRTASGSGPAIWRNK